MISHDRGKKQFFKISAGFIDKKLYSVGIELVGFYGISTVVGYLMPNHVFTYILDISFVNTFCRYIQLNDRTVLFLTVQFSVNQQI